MADISGWSSGPYGSSSWGGSAYDRTVAEGGAASELLSALGVFIPTIAEGSALTTLLDSSGNNFTAAIVEAGTGAETVSGNPYTPGLFQRQLRALSRFWAVTPLAPVFLSLATLLIYRHPYTSLGRLFPRLWTLMPLGVGATPTMP